MAIGNAAYSRRLWLRHDFCHTASMAAYCVADYPQHIDQIIMCLSIIEPSSLCDRRSFLGSSTKADPDLS